MRLLRTLTVVVKELMAAVPELTEVRIRSHGFNPAALIDLSLMPWDATNAELFRRNLKVMFPDARIDVPSFPTSSEIGDETPGYAIRVLRGFLPAWETIEESQIQAEHPPGNDDPLHILPHVHQYVFIDGPPSYVRAVRICRICGEEQGMNISSVRDSSDRDYIT